MKIVSIDKDGVVNKFDLSKNIRNDSTLDEVLYPEVAGSVTHPKSIDSAVNRIKQCLNIS